jgi:hypothetical protein
VHNSLVVGKNAGNFAESAAFHENRSRKRLQIQQLEGQIPCADEQGIYLREQGIVSAFWTGAGNVAGGRFVRVEASIDCAEPVDSSDALAGFFPSHGRGGPH